jgi:hypothetical protein
MYKQPIVTAGEIPAIINLLEKQVERHKKAGNPQALYEFEQQIELMWVILRKYMVNTTETLFGSAKARLLMPMKEQQLLLPFEAEVVIDAAELQKKTEHATTSEEVIAAKRAVERERVLNVNERIEKFLELNPHLAKLDKNEVLNIMWVASNPENVKERVDISESMRLICAQIIKNSSIYKAIDRMIGLLKNWTKQEVETFVGQSALALKIPDDKGKYHMHLEQFVNPITKTEFGKEPGKDLFEREKIVRLNQILPALNSIKNEKEREKSKKDAEKVILKEVGRTIKTFFTNA